MRTIGEMGEEATSRGGTKHAYLGLCIPFAKARGMSQLGGGLVTRSCEFESRSRQRIFRCSLQCEINMNLVFHISEDGSEIDVPLVPSCFLKHC